MTHHEEEKTPVLNFPENGPHSKHPEHWLILPSTPFWRHIWDRGRKKCPGPQCLVLSFHVTPVPHPLESNCLIPDMCSMLDMQTERFSTCPCIFLRNKNDGGAGSTNKLALLKPQSLWWLLSHGLCELLLVQRGCQTQAEARTHHCPPPPQWALGPALRVLVALPSQGVPLWTWFLFCQLVQSGLHRASKEVLVTQTLTRKGVPINLFSFFGVFFCPFRAAPTAYGGSQAMGPMGAVAAGHSHSHERSEPHL